MILTNEDIKRFQKIVFEPCDESEIDDLNDPSKT